MSDIQEAARDNIMVSVDSEYMAGLRTVTGRETNALVVQDALTTLAWVAGELEAGRLVLSSNTEGQDVHRLMAPWKQ
jgi:hypothetical protein